jgi:hypothetical protein
MNILLSAIPGRGLKVLYHYLRQTQEQNEVDFTIVNVENADGGFGITGEIAEEILKAGADVLTSGNHIWDKREVFDFLAREPRLLRPGNYPKGAPGEFAHVGEAKRRPGRGRQSQGGLHADRLPVQLPSGVPASLGNADHRGRLPCGSDIEKMALGWF